MNDALKQAMIECLKIYVRTEMARSTAHPSENKICANWSNGAFMSIQNKYTINMMAIMLINMMDALKNDDYLEKYSLEDLWRNSFYNHNCDGTSFIYHYCNEPWAYQAQHPFIKYTSAIETVKDAVTRKYTNKVVHTLIAFPTTKEYIAEFPVKFTDNCLNVDGFKKAYEEIEKQFQKNNELQQKFACLRKLYEIKHICKE